MEHFAVRLYVFKDQHSFTTVFQMQMSFKQFMDLQHLVFNKRYMFECFVTIPIYPSLRYIFLCPCVSLYYAPYSQN